MTTPNSDPGISFLDQLANIPNKYTIVPDPTNNPLNQTLYADFILPSTGQNPPASSITERFDNFIRSIVPGQITDWASFVSAWDAVPLASGAELAPGVNNFYLYISFFSAFVNSTQASNVPLDATSFPDGDWSILSSNEGSDPLTFSFANPTGSTPSSNPNPFILAFNDFIKNFDGSKLSNGQAGSVAFLSQWDTFLSNTAVLQNSTATSQALSSYNLTSYEKIYSVFWPL